MIAEKTKAVATTTACKTEIPNPSYNSAHLMSSQLKREIGELLFCLEFPLESELHCFGLGILEKMLRQYVDFKARGFNP